MVGWIVAALGGSAGLTLLLARGAITALVSHSVKQYLNRRSARRRPGSHREQG